MFCLLHPIDGEVPEKTQIFFASLCQTARHCSEWSSSHIIIQTKQIKLWKIKLIRVAVVMTMVVAAVALLLDAANLNGRRTHACLPYFYCSEKRSLHWQGTLFSQMMTFPYASILIWYASAIFSFNICFARCTLDFAPE